MDPVTTISGINGLIIYIYNNVKYYFFGDIHGNNKNNCDNFKNCDYFDYQFKNIKTYGTDCTTIGPLLFKWFEYNDKHKINTGFYLEKSYKSLIDYQFYDNLKRENYNTLATIFSEEMSWLELTKLLLNKKYNHVDIHNIDIRFYNHENIIPFKLKFIDIDKLDIYDINIKNDIVNLINLLVLNYKFIINSILTNSSSQKLFDFVLSKMKSSLKYQYQYVIKKHNQHKHIISDKLNELLYKNPELYQKIIDFTLSLSEEHMEKIDTKNLNDYNTLSDENKLLTLQLYIIYYSNIFTVLSAYIMDAYVIASLFLNDNEENIVYTGLAHTEIYNLFFKYYLNQSPVFEYTNTNKKCITFENLPEYLDINKYR